MDKNKEKQYKKERRRARVRAKIKGSKELPRLNVFKSNTGVYAQIINDEKGVTLVSVSTKEIKKGTSKDKEKSAGIAKGFAVGELLAKKAKEKKISQVVFDRGGNKYHGQIQAVADGARSGGLLF